MPSSNDANDANDANQANAGSIGASAGAFFSDRIDLPFVTIEFAPGSPVAQQRRYPKRFPPNGWSATWYAYLVLTQFVGTDWQNFDLLTPLELDGVWDSIGSKATEDHELDILVQYARNERSDALGEIVSQSDSFIGYFLDLLTANGGYPATVKVMTAASFVASFVAMYYKGKYERPRPTQLCPALMPPIPVPGHASFPSGHSTQAHLIALCMSEVLVDVTGQAALSNDLRALADRIARNREIGGFHYPTDTQAGVNLAESIHPLLLQNTFPVDPETNLQPPTWFQTLVTAAKQEWA